MIEFKNWAGQEIWINPSHVIAVVPHPDRSGHATLLTTGRDDEGDGLRIAVRGEVSEVVKRLIT